MGAKPTKVINLRIKPKADCIVPRALKTCRSVAQIDLHKDLAHNEKVRISDAPQVETFEDAGKSTPQQQQQDPLADSSGVQCSENPQDSHQPKSDALTSSGQTR